MSKNKGLAAEMGPTGLKGLKFRPTREKPLLSLIPPSLARARGTVQMTARRARQAQIGA